MASSRKKLYHEPGSSRHVIGEQFSAAHGVARAKTRHHEAMRAAATDPIGTYIQQRIHRACEEELHRYHCRVLMKDGVWLVPVEERGR